MTETVVELARERDNRKADELIKALGDLQRRIERAMLLPPEVLYPERK